MGERKTLRLVAQYADACNLFDAGPEVIAHKIEVLHGHCADLGRDPTTVEKTVITSVDPVSDTDQFLALARTYAALGVTTLRVGSGAPDLPGWVTRVGAEVLPQVRDL